MQIACIGARELPQETVLACREMGLALARAGYTIMTGVTPGVPGQDEWADWGDGAFATGAYYASPNRLIVCLPWQRYPRGSPGLPPGVQVAYAEEHPAWTEATQRCWEATQEAGSWQVVRRASRLRLARVAGIVLQARLLLAWPGEDDEESRFALAFAAWRGVPAIDLALVAWREVLKALLDQESTQATSQQVR